jgi:hypothetical protein
MRQSSLTTRIRNQECQSCGGKSLPVRTTSPFRLGEKACCHWYGNDLQARDAGDLLRYSLVERPLVDLDTHRQAAV